MSESEPWLRGTLTDVPAVQRAVLHALHMAEEDLIRWCGHLDQQQLLATPCNLPSIAFHIRHIARSVDRLLTYAQDKQLSMEQLEALQSESDGQVEREPLFEELTLALERACLRIREFPVENLADRRFVGRRRLPTTLGGLLIHIAEHTLRHVGQAITTAKVVAGKIPESQA
jgi:uncharacterized damage-inducible protein DinB